MGLNLSAPNWLYPLRASHRDLHMEPDLSQAEELVTGAFLVSCPNLVLWEQGHAACKCGTGGASSAPAQPSPPGECPQRCWLTLSSTLFMPAGRS